MRAETLVGKTQLHFICEKAFVLGAMWSTVYYRSTESLLKLVLILRKGRLMKASLVFPMTLSCELSLPRAVSHSALLVVGANKPERAVLISDIAPHRMAVSECCTCVLSEQDDDTSVLCCVSRVSTLSPACLTSRHVQSDFAIFLI